jgi:hypothetical protein
MVDNNFSDDIILNVTVKKIVKAYNQSADN